MDLSNMSEEEMKRQTTGKCCFSILTVISTAAFICGLYANAWCDFVERQVVFEEDVDLRQVCTEFEFEDTAIEALCNTLFSDHGVGFYGWYGTVPVDQQLCFDYTLPIPNVGYVTPEFDTKFNSARAFAITANVLGAFAWFTLSLSSCCKLDQERLLGMTSYFFAACLFQGLTLIIFRSDICDVGFFAQYFPDRDLDGIVAKVNCSLGRGAKYAICATVFYFVCNSITPLAIVPDPIGYRRAAVAEEEAPVEARAAERAAEEQAENVPAAISETEEA